MKAFKGGKSGNGKDKNDPNLLRVIKEYEQKGKKVRVNESDKKYSAMLLDLISPYHEAVPDAEELEWLLELAVIAWNIATIKKELGNVGNVMLKETKEELKDDKEAIKLIEKLIKDKTKKFGKEDFLIRDLKLNEDENGVFVIATAMPFSEFLLQDMDEEEANDEDDWDDEMNFLPGYINRNGFSLVPKQPFIEWMQRLEGNSLFPVEITETPVYLLAEKESNEAVEAWLKKNFDTVFRRQLESWHTDEKEWPKNRTYKMFSEWFDVKHHSMVFDLEDFPVDKDIE
ncbi:MAG: hypothetical protein EOO14_12605 [Chitinophagaceae bacterium]|nr:MAG: hypothetical protein EOO14_12605 [Chitinophagaceae bacterium]